MKYHWLSLAICGLATNGLLASCNPQPPDTPVSSPTTVEPPPTGRSVTINSPTESISCDIVEEDNNQCLFTVQGTASDLQDGDYLSVWLTQSGATWWKGGESIRYGELFTTNWAVPLVGVDAGGGNWTMKAIITDEATAAGTPSGGLPDNLAASDPINIKLD